MKKLSDIHKLLDYVDLTINADADKEVLERVLRASRESATSAYSGDSDRVRLGTKSWGGGVFWRTTGCVAAVLLVVLSWMAIDSHCQVNDLRAELELARQEVVLVRRDLAMMQQKEAVAPVDDSATINLYLHEHRDVMARHASFRADASPSTQIRVSQDDILYYELFDEGPERAQPGIIVRGPSSQPEIASSGTPIISNGHTLSLLQAQATAGFELHAPPWLNPGFALDQIRRIDGRDALQLLYTDGINTVSLFEQPVDGQRGLSRQDFREYAVYRNLEQAGGTILAWKDDALAYVLIGNADMSQLMNMAQAINARR